MYLVFVQLKVVKGVKKNIVSLKYFVKFSLFLCFIKLVVDTKIWTTLLIFYTLNFRQISQYLSQFLSYKNGRPHFGNLKTRPIWCYPTLWSQSYAKLQYIISAYSRAYDLPKFFSDLDPELYFKLFLKEHIIFIEWTIARTKIC